jgi:hypothetical protein
MLLETIERIKQDSEGRPLSRQEIKVLNMLAPQFTEAQRVLQKRAQDGVKKENVSQRL